MAKRLVPKSQEIDWDLQFSGPLWDFMLEAAAAGTPDSQFAVDDHVKRAVRAAFKARFSRQFFDGPLFILSSGIFAVLLLVIASGGLSVVRQFVHQGLHGLPYRDPGQVVILAQGPPYFGIRLGFREHETEMFREHAQSIESIASYTWNTTTFVNGSQHREAIAAEVSSSFFPVLGVGPALGQGLVFPKNDETKYAGIRDSRAIEILTKTSYSKIDGLETFLVSDDFWHSELGGNPAAIGQKYEIGGRPMRLMGVLPRHFSFLATPIAIWMEAPPEPPMPKRQWWMALRGVVARLRPGVPWWAAEQDLQKVVAGIPPQNFRVHATPVADLVYRAPWSYTTDFLIAFGAILGWAAFHLVRDHRLGAPWRLITRFWAFFVLKALLPLLALFILMIEFTKTTWLGVTGGVRPGQGPLGVWLFYSALAMILLWACRDQPQRCRVCLRRMYHPIRIGVPGQVLLETSGQEVMCPEGHGSVFTSESVLGAEISDRWIGFP